MARVRRHEPANIGLPVPVACELYYGSWKSRQTVQDLDLLDRKGFEIVPFDASDAHMANAVRSRLEAIFPRNSLMYKNNVESVNENTGRKGLPLML